MCLDHGQPATSLSLGRNEHIQIHEDGFGVILYTSEILRYHSDDNTIALDTGGFHTATTKHRINFILNTLGIKYKVVQRSKRWLVETPTDTRPFRDGMRLPV